MADLDKIKAQIAEFSKDSSKELKFDIAFSGKEREQIHEFVQSLSGLESNSVKIPGKSGKCMIITKVDPKTMLEKKFEFTAEVIKFFSRWSRVPFPVPTEQYREYTITTLDKYYDCVAKWKKFEDYTKRFKSFGQLSSHFNKVRSQVIAHIVEHADTKKFSSTKYEFPGIKKGKNYYQLDNDGKTLISIDIKSANFTVLSSYFPAIFNNKKTWREFMSEFTDVEFILDSKQLREEIFGETGLTKKILNQCYVVIDKVMKFVATELKHDYKVIFVSHDEVVYDVSDVKELNLVKLQEDIAKQFGDIFHVEQFKLKYIGKDAYVREYSDGKVDIKNAQLKHILQYAKHYEGKQCLANDLKFMDCDIVAAYEKGIYD
jgi:hypothetical protein